ERDQAAADPGAVALGLRARPRLRPPDAHRDRRAGAEPAVGGAARDGGPGAGRAGPVQRLARPLLGAGPGPVRSVAARIRGGTRRPHPALGGLRRPAHPAGPGQEAGARAPPRPYPWSDAMWIIRRDTWRNTG